ncbi:helix-turn-helix domain-containing protein [Cochlodiniinecator piscidefendens]|uniref:helix-turn-helix domain-containing protein n=1 Tax=Cochlodiniinecator piscidefendens TaxID=2715756 RepID=UPI00140CFEE7|nr:XRE family transcriptional regulator [Cochlodiniinecator piscidefendens]
MTSHVLVGSRIRDRRSALGIKQSDLARDVGISPSYLNLIEHNRRRIAGKLLSDLARALGVEVALLSEGVEAQLLVSLRDAASMQSIETEAVELDRLEEFVGRFPGWASLLAGRHKNGVALEQTVEALTDRLSHDPILSEALHEVLSKVTSIRSTSSILAQSDEIDPQWQRRFQTNLFEDAELLSKGAQALVSYLDGAQEGGVVATSAQEELDGFWARHDYYLPLLETPYAGDEQIEQLIAGCGFGLPASRIMLNRQLQEYLEDARALPEISLVTVAEQLEWDPLKLANRFKVSMLQVMRRLACIPEVVTKQPIGRVTCDGTGGVTFRKEMDSFAIPQFGATCPLWPLYQAMTRPGTPVRTFIFQSGRAKQNLTAYAYAEQKYPEGFDGAPVLEAQMIVFPANGVQDETVSEVGANCRICARRACVARREPSILSDAF